MSLFARKERYKRIRKEKKEKGLCKSCPKPAINKYGYCEEHYAKYRRIHPLTMEEYRKQKRDKVVKALQKRAERAREAEV